MEWMFYVFAGVMAAAITASGVYMLRWAGRTGQLKDFDKQALSIFDEGEPVGTVTDRFPGKTAAKKGDGR